ncbi:anti-sigma factor domain-containing protein [Streptomyces sp. NPDC089424]|uniref:anti-sigma factor n=1 Tax=Streptomyces sp. NPDC089424 TaxID=3365917 RepID=UPI0038144CFB
MRHPEDPCADVGAYALHALPPDEEAAFESHLATCAACRREADEASLTLARLGAVEGREPSADLRRRVLERISAEGRERSVAPRQDRLGQRGLLLALAASVAAAAGVGGIAWWQHTEAHDTREQVAEAEADTQALVGLLSATDVKMSTARLPDSATASVIASRAQDRTAFIASGLPPLREGQVYQLWYERAWQYRPAGLLHSAGGRQAQVLAGPLNGATAVCVTVEPAGGAAQPTTTPLARIPVLS